MNEMEGLEEHMAKVQTIVLDGNKRFHVVTNARITYTGNNVLLYWYWKFKGRKGSLRTTFKWRNV